MRRCRSTSHQNKRGVIQECARGEIPGTVQDRICHLFPCAAVSCRRQSHQALDVQKRVTVTRFRDPIRRKDQRIARLPLKIDLGYSSFGMIPSGIPTAGDCSVRPSARTRIGGSIPDIAIVPAPVSRAMTASAMQAGASLPSVLIPSRNV